MDFRIVFFELLLLLLLLLFLEDKCNYVELNMSFTLFFKIYAHPPTCPRFACFYSEPTEVRDVFVYKESDVGASQKKNK